MESFFEHYQLEIGEQMETPFMNKNGVFQDGTTPMYRDTDGRLWAMSGHSHMGHIAMFCGTSLDDMQKMWPIETNFSIGHAEYAFLGIRYPEGILPRGSIWPFGLYICPNTHRFFCWFHNETGWNGRGTAYDAFGPCTEPKYDSDFRHVGLMHSDDEGKTWNFDRWVLTGQEVAFTERYNPGAGNALGQKGDIIRFGSGDFSVFVEPEGDYIYLFYNIITMNLAGENGKIWQTCDAYVARCRKRTDGNMGDFVKYYDGSFSEAGNLGKESLIIKDAWHPRVVYSVPEQMYIMTSKPIMKSSDMMKLPGMDEKRKVMQICVSKDLLHWSEPEIVYRNGAVWGNHYNAIISDDKDMPPNILASNCFSVLNNHNGTDVFRYKTRLLRK